MKVKPYEPGDTRKITHRDGDDWNTHDQEVGMAYTIWDGDTPIACGGIIPNYVGVGSVWCVISDKARNHGIELTKKIRFLMNDTMSYYSMYRLNSMVKSDKKEYVRWAKLFGFEVEGVLKKAAPDKGDLFIMGKVN